MLFTSTTTLHLKSIPPFMVLTLFGLKVMLFHLCYHFFISSESPVSLIYATCTFISSFPEQLVPTFQLWILFYFPLIAIMPVTSGFMLHTRCVELLNFVVLLQTSHFSFAFQQIFLLELQIAFIIYWLSDYQPGCVSPKFLLPLLWGFFCTIVQASLPEPPCLIFKKIYFL